MKRSRVGRSLYWLKGCLHLRIFSLTMTANSYFFFLSIGLNWRERLFFSSSLSSTRDAQNAEKKTKIEGRKKNNKSLLSRCDSYVFVLRRSPNHHCHCHSKKHFLYITKIFENKLTKHWPHLLFINNILLQCHGNKHCHIVTSYLFLSSTPCRWEQAKACERSIKHRLNV